MVRFARHDHSTYKGNENYHDYARGHLLMLKCDTLAVGERAPLRGNPASKHLGGGLDYVGY